MGMAVGGGGAGPKSDINVTPLVDVVLVLLIIFIASMPVLLRNIPVEVPRKLESDEVVVSNSKTVQLLGKFDGTIEMDDGSEKVSVNRADLAKSLKELLEGSKEEKIVFVDFEDSLPYADVVSIMDTLKSFEQRDSENRVKEGTSQVKIALKIREQNPAAPAAAP